METARAGLNPTRARTLGKNMLGERTLLETLYKLCAKHGIREVRRNRLSIWDSEGCKCIEITFGNGTKLVARDRHPSGGKLLFPIYSEANLPLEHTITLIELFAADGTRERLDTPVFLGVIPRRLPYYYGFFAQFYYTAFGSWLLSLFGNPEKNVNARVRFVRKTITRAVKECLEKCRERELQEMQQSNRASLKEERTRASKFI